METNKKGEINRLFYLFLPGARYASPPYRREAM
jgi:hypothetical protein